MSQALQRRCLCMVCSNPLPASCHPHSQTRGQGWRGSRKPTRAAPLEKDGAGGPLLGPVRNVPTGGEKQRVWAKEGRELARGGTGKQRSDSGSHRLVRLLEAVQPREEGASPQGRFRPTSTSLCKVRMAMLPRQGYILPISLNFVYFEEKENQNRKEIMIISIITQVILKYPFQVMFTLENYQLKVR